MALAFVFVNGQTNVDSLRDVVKNAKADTVKIEALNNLAVIYSQTNVFISRQYADSALNAINLAQKNPKNTSVFYEKNKGRCYNTISHIDFQQGNFNNAIQNCLKTIKIFEKFKDVRNVSKLYSSLGIILKSIGNNKDALFYIRKSVKLDETSRGLDKNDKQIKLDLTGSYINLMSTFLELNYFDSCLFYASKSFNLIDTSEKSEDLGLVYTNMGGAYAGLKNHKLALHYTLKALEIYIRMGFLENISLAYSNLSELYLEAKNFTNALKFSNLSEDINRRNSFSDNLLNTYEIKARIYSELKDTKNEILFLKKHAQLKDSLLNQNHAIKMEELKTQYETEKKETEISKLNKDNKIQELQLDKDAATKNRLILIIIAVVSILILLGMLAAFLFKIIAERKKAYIKLQEKNIEIQNQSEKLSRQSKLISKYQSQMNPHFVFNALNNIQGMVINNEKEKTISQLQLFSQLMRQTLNNSESEAIGLTEEINYLNSYLSFEQARFTNTIGFAVDCCTDINEILIPPMMIQPFIENAIKHAGLNEMKNPKINLQITPEDNLLKIEISDNGKGIDLNDESIVKNSHAIAIIKSRIQILFKASDLEMKDHYFSIISKPQLKNGTTIKFYLPLMYKY